MTIEEKIKTYLRKQNIPFEKKHKHDIAEFSYKEEKNYIIVFTRYSPFSRKLNPRMLEWLAGTPYQYNEHHSYYTIFNRDGDIVLESIDTFENDGYTKVLDENNLILPTKDNPKHPLCHFKKINNNWEKFHFFTSWFSSADIFLRQKLLLLEDNSLYNYENGEIIPILFDEILYKDYYEDLFKKWNIIDKNSRKNLYTLLENKINNQNLFVAYKRVAFQKDDVSCYFDTIAFIDKKGNIKSNLFYRDHNHFMSNPITNETFEKVFDNLLCLCKNRVEKYLAANKLDDLTNEIIKKLI